jgi:hypothetical protein
MQFCLTKALGAKFIFHSTLNKHITYEFTHYKWFTLNHRDSSTKEGDTTHTYTK